MARILFDHVAKRFGDVRVLEDINLEIRDQEFMVFVGPSGCGKSTALRMIAGLEEISDGNLYIGDRIVNDVHPKDRDTAMVFQSYALYPHMTVRENISFGLRIRKIPAQEIENSVNDAAEILGLADLLDRKPKALSGGQRQRVALGRAIVRKPSVFLFDEPLSNLDAELRVQMRAQLSQLQRRLKTTTVYVTHDQIEAMTMGHRISVLSPLRPDGKTNLEQCGTPLELYDHPANLFVARFIGTPNMNIVDASLNEAGDRIEHAAFTIPLAEIRRGGAVGERRGKSVTLGIRPEHISSPEELDSEHPVTFEGVVEIIETVGHEVVIHARVNDELLIAKLGSHQTLPDYGQSMQLALDADAIHLFNPETEQRI
ncbi:MAG: sn-glycerol-3-phosphate ABC transporter ATP-binding protein UgpC [Gammaproteobacteria bacterium]